MGALHRLRRWLARLSPAAEGAGPAATPTTRVAEGDTYPGGGSGRVNGEPPSLNGASSFHLFWELRDELVAVAATLEVRQAPAVDRLYFWALQAAFTGPGGRRGGAGHLGLQFHPGCPGRTAANWGGYDERGRVLDGTASALPTSLGNPHTRDFDWRPRRRYRLSIRPAPPGDQPADGRTAWRGTITELGEDGGGSRTTVVRDLLAHGDRLSHPMVWSEVFARCEHPPVEVRWSDLEGTTTAGRTVRPAAVRLNFQADADGGCANTSSWRDGDELVQRTATVRSSPPGTRLALGGDGSRDRAARAAP